MWFVLTGIVGFDIISVMKQIQSTYRRIQHVFRSLAESRNLVFVR